MERGIFRSANSVAEQLVVTGRVRLHAIIPELVTTGTITIRDGAAADASGTTKHVMAIGALQAGKDFKGATFYNGITVQQSVGTDQHAVVYERF